MIVLLVCMTPAGKCYVVPLAPRVRNTTRSLLNEIEKKKQCYVYDTIANEWRRLQSPTVTVSPLSGNYHDWGVVHGSKANTTHGSTPIVYFHKQMYQLTLSNSNSSSNTSAITGEWQPLTWSLSSALLRIITIVPYNTCVMTNANASGEKKLTSVNDEYGYMVLVQASPSTPQQKLAQAFIVRPLTMCVACVVDSSLYFVMCQNRNDHYIH
jgi:hypothetical protein